MIKLRNSLAFRHALKRVAIILLFATFVVEQPACIEARAESNPQSYMKAVKLGDNRGTLRVDGRRRDYFVHLPPSYGDKPAPLVILLHGALTNARLAAINSRLSKRADRDGFIACYPNGTGLVHHELLTWNAGDCCGLAQLKKVDDVEFLKQLILKLKREYNIDENRVYIAGVSNGGMMAYKAGQELSDQIAGIASVGGCMMSATSTVGKPVSVMVIHGAGDQVVPYDGGRGGLPIYKITGTKVTDNVKYWVEHNNCLRDPIREETKLTVSELYKSGADGTEVCLYTYKKAKHVWPGGLLTDLLLMPMPSATDIMCDFLLKHSKNAATSTELVKEEAH